MLYVLYILIYMFWPTRRVKTTAPTALDVMGLIDRLEWQTRLSIDSQCCLLTFRNEYVLAYLLVKLIYLQVRYGI